MQPWAASKRGRVVAVDSRLPANANTPGFIMHPSDGPCLGVGARVSVRPNAWRRRSKAELCLHPVQYGQQPLEGSRIESTAHFNPTSASQLNH